MFQKAAAVQDLPDNRLGRRPFPKVAQFSGPVPLGKAASVGSQQERQMHKGRWLETQLLVQKQLLMPQTHRLNLPRLLQFRTVPSQTNTFLTANLSK